MDKNQDRDDAFPASSVKPSKKHLIRPRWLRIALKTLMWIVIGLLLLPVALYIPPVQTLVKNVACKAVYSSTGMKADIGRFRLRFPLDISLENVTVLDVKGDTMVSAKEALLDVKLLPLLGLDVKINRLRLTEGYYRMVSPDSSMIMSVRAGRLDTDDRCSANIRTGRISLHEAVLRDGSVQLYMDVWKQKKTPADSTSSTPFLILADDLRLENFTFGMSMLPVIDTLSLNAKDIRLAKGVVDLGKNRVSWNRASITGGNGRYITPTPEWAAAHPAPPSEPSQGPPMIIEGDSIALDGFAMVYAVKDAVPMAGFDPSYIEVTDVGLGMRNFYNESSTVRLPLTRLAAKERSGLRITGGSGTVGVDSTGLTLRSLDISTLYSYIKGSADVPFALMELKPEAPVNVSVKARLGLPDVDAFMPSLREYTSLLPARNPMELALEADGSLTSVDITRLDASLRDVFSLQASGYADNPLDIKKLDAEVGFEGSLADPRIMDRFTGESGIKVPAFRIKGEATASHENYGADFTLLSTAGDVSGKGSVGMNSEHYDVDLHVDALDVSQFAPGTGIGLVTASVAAEGTGFNPVSGRSVTDARLRVESLEYNNRALHDIRADIVLDRDGQFDIYAVSSNAGLDLDVEGNGVIRADDYTFDIAAHIRDLDLHALGLSKEMSGGKGNVFIAGTASPARWLYAADLKIDNFDWNLPNSYIHIPGGLTARIDATQESTSVSVDSYMTAMRFESPTGLKALADAFAGVGEITARQLAARNISVDSISAPLPPFELSLSASGRGLVNQFLVPQGMSVDTIFGRFSKDSLLRGDLQMRRFTSSALDIDTAGLVLAERGKLMDYRLHVGNRRGTLDEFAQVDLRGYLGANRLGAFLTQRNIQGKTGYRLGLTASLMDSTVSVHFTPLNSTIAYLPWTFNEDNFIDYGLVNRKLEAKLMASSAESSILLETEPAEGNFDELHLKLDNIRIEDFLSMSVFAPPVSGSIDSDLRVSYNGNILRGSGTLDVDGLTYEKYRLGDFNLSLRAGMGHNGGSGVAAGLRINGSDALSLYARMSPDSVSGLHPDSVGLTLTRFPLSVVNPFLGDMASLAGHLSGGMKLDGSFSKPLLNGSLAFDSVTAHIPMAGATLRFDHGPVTITNSVVDFDRFGIYGANDNPITIDGTVDASSFSNILLNLGIDARNTQLIKSDKRSKADIFGKLFVDLKGSVKGSMNVMDIRADLNILGTSDVTYRLGASPAELGSASGENGVVKFVNFNDTAQVVKADSVAASSSMRIRAGLTISPGTRAKVLLSTNGTDRVELQPTANLNYFQNYMGDMRLNGTLTLGEGFVRYSLPVIKDKMFEFNPSSTVTWGGDIMNPSFNITATDEMKVNVSQGSSTHLVNFLVTLKATGNLNAPKVAFDLSTNDDLSIQNELQSMSSDQRQTQAMNLLLTGQYTGQNAKTATSGFSGEGMLYSYLASQINSWAAKNIRGVDLSFGVDQYDKMQNGASSTETSYSYQVSKSLFNNRFKILVGGNYSTDSSADENLSQNLISDISFEYMLKQTETQNMAVRLFRHTGFESILEGEIIETGVGFVMKRKLQNLLHLFRFRHKKRRETTDSVVSAPEGKDSLSVNDSTRKEDLNEK